jgi:hypothetical protein
MFLRPCVYEYVNKITNSPRKRAAITEHRFRIMKEIKIMMNMEKINNEALENVVGGIFVSKNTGHGVYAYDKHPLFPSMPELGMRGKCQKKLSALDALALGIPLFPSMPELGRGM